MELAQVQSPVVDYACVRDVCDVCDVILGPVDVCVHVVPCVMV